MDFYLKIAGLPFHVTGWQGIDPLYSRRLRDYCCEAVDNALPVVITDETKSFEYAEATQEGFQIPGSQCEFLSMMRQIVKASVQHGRMFIHGAGIAFRGHGYLFTAPSGTGKTTHIGLWKKYLGNDVEFINGDKPVLSFDDTVSISGNPWAGKEGYQKSKTVPLDAVILLNRGTVNTLHRVSPQAAIAPLYRQIFFIDDPVATPLILGFLDQLLRQVPVYDLHCTMAEEALRCSFEGLTKLDYETEKRRLCK